MGMNTSVLARFSPLDRSARTAKPRPNTVASPVTATTHQRLFQSTPRRLEKIGEQDGDHGDDDER